MTVTHVTNTNPLKRSSDYSHCWVCGPAVADQTEQGTPACLPPCIPPAVLSKQTSGPVQGSPSGCRLGWPQVFDKGNSTLCSLVSTVETLCVLVISSEQIVNKCARPGSALGQDRLGMFLGLHHWALLTLGAYLWSYRFSSG